MRLLNEQEAAEQIGVSVAALRKWRQEERGLSYVKVGRLVKYREQDIQSFIEINLKNLQIQIAATA